jgi:hypothetical protein
MRNLFELKKHVSIIMRDVMLLWKNPKEYLYSFTYSNTKKVAIYPFDISVQQFGEHLVKTIETKYPHMHVQIFGSTALGIAGQKDIDLMIYCSPKDLPAYTNQLATLFGPPIKQRNQFSEWSFEKDSYAIQIMIIDPGHPIAKKMHNTYEVLKKNHSYVREYEAIKVSSNGVSEREYTRRRLQFFTEKGL